MQKIKEYSLTREFALLLHVLVLLQVHIFHHISLLTWNICQPRDKPGSCGRELPGVCQASLFQLQWKALLHFSPAPEVILTSWSPPYTEGTSPYLHCPWASGGLPTPSCKKCGHCYRNQTWRNRNNTSQQSEYIIHNSSVFEINALFWGDQNWNLLELKLCHGVFHRTSSRSTAGCAVMWLTGSCSGQECNKS